MKPSERIAQIMKEIVKKEVGEKNPYDSWETQEDLVQLEMITQCEGYLLRSILDYLDEKNI